jgi:hypothetical protein
MIGGVPMKNFRIICLRRSLEQEPGDVLIDWRYRKSGGHLFLKIGFTTAVVGGDESSLSRFPIGSTIRLDQFKETE